DWKAPPRDGHTWKGTDQDLAWRIQRHRAAPALPGHAGARPGGPDRCRSGDRVEGAPGRRHGSPAVGARTSLHGQIAVRLDCPRSSGWVVRRKIRYIVSFGNTIALLPTSW